MDNHQPRRPEPTSPIWRVLAIALAAGSVAALGFYMKEVGRAGDFATVVVVALAYTVGFWADKRPDKLRLRLGPFSKIAEAVRESRGDLRRWVHAKPLRVGFALAVGYGILIVAAKGVVVGLMSSLYSWHLAVAAGAAIAAVAAAPHLFANLKDRLSISGDEDDDPDPPEEEPDEPRIRPSDDDEPPSEE